MPNNDQEHDPTPAQEHVINQLEPIHRVLGAHRKLWLTQEPREPARPPEWLIFAASISPMLVGMALTLIFETVVWAYVGIATTALAMIWPVRVAWVQIARDQGSMARGDDDLELSERVSYSIAALRDDLRSFPTHDLEDVLLGRARRHAKKIGFLSASSITRILSLAVAFVTVIPTFLSLISQPIKDALVNFLSSPVLYVPVLGVVFGFLLMFVLLPLALGESQGWLEWELEALRRAKDAGDQGSPASSENVGT